MSIAPNVVVLAPMPMQLSERRRIHRSHQLHGIALPSAELRSEDEPHRVGEPPPFADFPRQLFASRGREVVEARATIVVGDAPLAAHPAGRLEALERGIERTVIDEKRTLRRMLDRERDAMSVVRSERQRSQHEKVERPLKERGAVGGLGGFSSRHSTRWYGDSRRESTGGRTYKTRFSAKWPRWVIPRARQARLAAQRVKNPPADSTVGTPPALPNAHT